jgi:hypothetical protein
MTATLLAVSARSDVGGPTEPLPWAPPASSDTSTHLELGAVANSALRDVLESSVPESETGLRLSGTSPTTVVLSKALSSLIDQRIRVFISGTVADDIRGASEVLRWMSSTTGQLVPADEGVLAWIVGPEQGLDAADEAPTRASDVVAVVEWLTRLLGVPDGDVLEAAKVKRRNWHNWKNGSSPRLESQGQLWALVNSVRTLSDLLDGDLADWLRVGGVERRQLLKSGRHRQLVQEAVAELTEQNEFVDKGARQRRDRMSAGYYE